MGDADIEVNVVRAIIILADPRDRTV